MGMLIPLLLLGACGGSAPANNASSAQAETDRSEPVADSAIDDRGNGVVALPPAATPTPTVASTFPAPFRGRWGMVANDCDPARADAKGLMTVEADRLRFYESRGAPTRIEIASPFKLTAELAFTGEGQSWTKRTTMTLIEGGRTIIREESGPAASNGTCVVRLDPGRRSSR